MSKKKYTNEFVDEMIKEKYGDEFIRIGDCGSYSKRFNVVHVNKECENHTFETDMQRILKGTLDCPICGTHVKLTHEQFVLKMKIKRPDVEVIGKYNGCKNKILVRCNVHDVEFEGLADNLLTGHKKCPKCSKLPRRGTNEFYEKISEIQNDEISVLDFCYNGDKKTSLCMCNKCKNEFTACTSRLLKYKKHCPFCSGGVVFTHDTFVSRLNNVNKTITVLSKYENSEEKVLCECDECKTKWYAKSSNLLSGRGCPKCRKSHGERRIHDLLEKNNVEFECQKKYDSLVGVSNGKLSYDFYIPSKNVLIEFQGEFHDGTVCFQTEESFDRQRKHDALKREYAISNNIKLLEIWYYQRNEIEEILTNEGLINDDKGGEKWIV